MFTEEKMKAAKRLLGLSLLAFTFPTALLTLTPWAEHKKIKQ